MGNWYIYGIRENIDGAKYRYVGYTTTPIQERLSMHLFEARKGAKPYASLKWMKSKDFEVVIEEIETVVAGDRETLYTREKHWIAHYRSIQGSLADRLTEDYLLNIADGGGGAVGYKHTPEECERRRGQSGHWTGVTGEAHPSFGRTNSEEHRKAVSDSYKTNPRSGKDSHRYGVIASDETRQKQSEAKIGNKASIATRFKMSRERLIRGNNNHLDSHTTKIKHCKWCHGADLHTEIKKREIELNGNKVE